MKHIDTHQLHVMQDGFRLSPREMWDMWGFLCKSGYFNAKSLKHHDPARTSLVAIVITEDGKAWIRDGLHRVAVVHMFGRWLRADEYTVEEMTYDMFTAANIEKGWFTPFDPKTEVRRANFHSFKQAIESFRNEGVDPVPHIDACRDQYCVPRSPLHTLDTFCLNLRTQWRDLQRAEEDWITA